MVTVVAGNDIKIGQYVGYYQLDGKMYPLTSGLDGCAIAGEDIAKEKEMVIENGIARLVDEPISVEVK